MTEPMTANPAPAQTAPKEGAVLPMVEGSQADAMTGMPAGMKTTTATDAQSEGGPIKPPPSSPDATDTLPPNTARMPGDKRTPLADPSVLGTTPEEMAIVDKEFKSRGWKIHNEITYRGLDWILNSTVGVGTAFWTSRTESGKQYFERPVSAFFEKLLKPILKTPAATAEGAKWGTSFAGIMAGGFAIIPLMMVMEDKNNKKKMVKWLDEKTYGKEVVANDPKFEEAYKRIDEEPKKGLGIGLLSRLFAITPLIIAASTPSINTKLIKYLYDPIGKGSKWVASKIGIKPSQNMLTKGAMVHLDGNPKTPQSFQNNWEFLHRTIGFDFGLTIFYALLHEASYKTLASMGMRKYKKEKDPVSGQPIPESMTTAEQDAHATPLHHGIPAAPMPAGETIPHVVEAPTMVTAMGQQTEIASDADKKFAANLTRREGADSIRAMAEQAEQKESIVQRTVDKGPRAATDSPSAENFAEGVQHSRELAGMAPSMG